METEHNECPICLRPMQDEHDYECGTCENIASQHLRVTTLCRLLRETQRRESSLIVQLEDAKATADLWIQKAKQADEAASDVITVLADARRHWKEELEEQARLLGMSAERECDLRGKLERERALADRLAEALKGIWPFIEEDIPHGCNSTGYMNAIDLCRANITAWKEARSE